MIERCTVPTLFLHIRRKSDARFLFVHIFPSVGPSISQVLAGGAGGPC